MKINTAICLRSAFVLSALFLMNVFSNAQSCSASFGYSANGCTLTFSNQSSGPGTLLWNWNFGDGNTSAQQNPVHTFSVAGTYTVCLAMQNTAGTCSGSYCLPITVNCVTGVSSGPYVEWSLSSFPNPVVSNLSVTYSLTGSANVHLALFDLMGREAVVLDNGNKSAGRHTQSFDVHLLPPGIYLLHFNCDGIVQTKKIILSK